MGNFIIPDNRMLQACCFGIMPAGWLSVTDLLTRAMTVQAGLMQIALRP